MITSLGVLVVDWLVAVPEKSPSMASHDGERVLQLTDELVDVLAGEVEPLLQERVHVTHDWLKLLAATLTSLSTLESRSSAGWISRLLPLGLVLSTTEFVLIHWASSGEGRWLGWLCDSRHLSCSSGLSDYVPQLLTYCCS